ncbi:hypothetical protein DFH07DRAFT_836242 [Mycena maculata]|uniref:AAA-ATPase-like domain-containing protein n=1 Tax=Mycena maculata TaxID=230809 RepID=A0AAD7N2E6_9AGAR|nr:hypothetical protein DFH07DRAFT_836242 [Mycena maculata]
MAAEHVEALYEDVEDVEWIMTPCYPIKDGINVVAEPYFIDEEEDVWALLSPIVSPNSKRVWSDDEEQDSSSGSERDPKRPKTRSLSPISFTTSSLRTSIDYDTYPQLPWDNYGFLSFRFHHEVVYVDKTHPILHLSDTFRHLLLRPPRFGKTAFLSTLLRYYDIQRADRFLEDFGSLAVVTNNSDAIPHHSQHLCLSFDFAGLDVSDRIENSLLCRVALRLQRLITDYATELQVCDPETFLIPEDSDTSLTPSTCLKKYSVDIPRQNLVRASSYTLFVGVDDYDAPILLRSFMHLEYPGIQDGYAGPRDIERLLDSYFWAPLHAGSDVIAKLFVTGTLALPSFPTLTSLHKLGLEVDPGLQLSCGFTEKEALQFSRTFLDQSPSILDLRRTCGEYIFSAEDGTGEAVLHPQQLILHIAELSGKPLMAFAPKSFPLLPGIFGLLSEESDVPNTVTLNGLIDLLASGTVEIDDVPREFDGTAVTWSALYDFGVLTYDSRSTLRVANDVVLSLIHNHVNAVFADRYTLQHELHAAVDDFAGNEEDEIASDPKPLSALFSQILRDQTRRALDNKGIEPIMCGVFQLTMGNTYSAAGWETDPAILPGVVDARSVVEIRNPDLGDVHRWALKTLTLHGMWRGANPNEEEPSADALRELHSKLIAEDEERLIERPYYVPQTGETALVGSFLDPEPDIPVFLAVGGARVLIRRA